MKNRNNLLILAIFLSVAPFPLRAEENLLKGLKFVTPTETADIRLMSKSGRELFQEFRRFAAVRGRGVVNWVMSHTDVGDSVMSGFSPTTLSSGTIQQLEVTSTGQVTRRAFLIPELQVEIEHPSHVALTGGARDPHAVVLSRTWSSPTGEVELEQSFFVKNVNGVEYGVQLDSHVKKTQSTIHTFNDDFYNQNNRFSICISQASLIIFF